MSDGLGEQNLENVTRPLEDAERWVIASYAMWSEYYSEGNWQYVAGSPVKEENAANMQLMLSRDWEIDDREDLLDTVMFLTALYEDEEDVDQEDIETGAWDLCRACQILGMGFVAGIIDREEMFGISMMVCGLMQFYYPSWMHLYSSYLNGYKEWRLGDGDEEDEEAQEDVEERKLLVMPGGPCSIPWNLELPIEYEEDEEDEEDEE